MGEGIRNLSERERKQYYQALVFSMQCISDDERKEWDRGIINKNLSSETKESVSK